MSRFAIRKPTRISKGFHRLGYSLNNILYPLNENYLTGSDITVTYRSFTLPSNVAITFEIVDSGTTTLSNDFDANSKVANLTNNTATVTFTNLLGLRTDKNYQVIAKDAGGNTLATSSQFTVLGATYNITGDTVNEGDNITVDVTINNVIDNATFYLTSTVPSTDITGDGQAEVTHTWTTGPLIGVVFDVAKEDALTEGNETFDVYIRNGSYAGSILATGNFTIVDTSKVVSITADKTTMTENDTVTFTITAEDYTDNLLATVSNSNVTADDFTSGTLTYNVSISGGTGTLAITTKEDGLTEGSETFDVVFTNADGQAVATSPTITITDSSTIALTQDKTSLNEGESVTFTLTGTNFDSGTITATVNGTVVAEDFTSGTLSHTVTMSGGTGSLTLTPIGDADSDGTDTFTVTFTNADGNVVATSPTITINDTSKVTGTSLSATSVNEGDTVTVTVTTQNATDGVTLYYDTELVSGNFLNPSDFADSALEGSFTITGNSGSFAKTFASDGFTEGTEVFKFNIRSGSTSGPIQATTADITVADTSTGVDEPVLVTSGLVLYLDAGDTSSYPGTGTTWSDLSGNGNNFTLDNANAYNSSGPKYMDFNGSYGMSYITPDLGVSGDVTYVLATRIKASTSDWRTLTRASSSGSDHHVIIERGSYDVGMYDNDGTQFQDSLYDQTSFPNYGTADWMLLYFRWNAGGGYKMSYNDTPGTIRADMSANANAQHSPGFYTLGGYNRSSQYWGDISLFMVYDRYLSDAELASNFNTFRSRYGL